MEALLLALLVALLYLVVYYRLLVGELQTRNAGVADRGGLLRVFTPPGRKHLKSGQLKYYRRYWAALATLLAVVAAAALMRFP